MTKGANLHDAIEMAHSGRPNRREHPAPHVETVDMRAIFRSKCRQAGHENQHWSWEVLRMPQPVQTQGTGRKIRTW
jgi:hypothetical protein